MTQVREAFFPLIKYLIGRRKHIFLETTLPKTILAFCHRPLKFFFNRGLTSWKKEEISMIRIKSK